MLCIKWRPFVLGLNELMACPSITDMESVITESITRFRYTVLYIFRCISLDVPRTFDLSQSGTDTVATNVTW